jgi:hypothetical protein
MLTTSASRINAAACAAVMTFFMQPLVLVNWNDPKFIGTV